MKNRRQNKSSKASKKKTNANDDTSEKITKSINFEKDSSSKKNRKVSWEDIKTAKTVEKEAKRAKVTTNVTSNSVKEQCKKSDKNKQTSVTNGLSRISTAKKATANEIADEEKALDVQTYLDTLPSEEIRKFIEGLIAEDKFNMLPVNTSALIGNIEMMEKYFKKDSETGKSKYDPNGRCLDGGTPLHAAIKAKNKQSVKLLLQNGADCSLVDFMGDNAIMAAIKAGDATVINTIWPNRGTLKVDHCNMLGMTALHLAAERSWEACISFLLQNRASPNIANGNGVTPLMIAASKGDLKVVECLVRAGADISVEDGEFNTSVSRAFAEKHQDVVDFLLRQMNGEKIVLFVRDLLDNIMHPPLPEKDYALVETRFLPLLYECTKNIGYRYAFYSNNAVHKITVKLEDSLKDIEDSIQTANLILCTFFKFGDELDKYFVKQFLKCKGPELIVHMVHFYTNDWKVSEKDSFFVFLPMIGLVELPEGRAWLSKNVLTVSEYFNLFEKDLLKVYITHSSYHEWCLESKFFKEINRVWTAFYNEIQKEQTFQRERHMAELLEQEDRERGKKERKLEKMKQKHQGKDLESALINLWTTENEEQSNEKACSNSNANSSRNGLGDWDYMSTGAERNDETIAVVKQSPTKDIFDINELVYEFEPVKGEAWTTVCTKKQKEKHSKDKSANKQDKKKKKDSKAKSVPFDNFPKQTPVNFIGTARWADVAKGINKKPTTPEHNTNNPTPAVQQHTGKHVVTKFGRTDFPSLEESPEKSFKPEKPTQMTFHFHSDGEPANEIVADYYVDDVIDTDQLDAELDAALEDMVDDAFCDVNEEALNTASECSKFHQEYAELTNAKTNDPNISTTGEITAAANVRENFGQLFHNSENNEQEHLYEYYNTKLDKEELNLAAVVEKLAIVEDEHDRKDNDTISTHEVQEQFENQHKGEHAENELNDLHEGQYQEKIESKNKITAVVSINDGIYKDTINNHYGAIDNSENISSCVCDESIEYQIKQLTSCGLLSVKDAKIYKNQVETFEEFEQMLNIFESDPFMDLSDALEYLRELEEPEEPSLIDEMFESPGHIPENIEEETEKECMQAEHIKQKPLDSGSANVIVTANFVHMQPGVESAKSAQASAISRPSNMPLSPSRDLVASDPAIIHCANTQLISKPRHSITERQCRNVQQNIIQSMPTDSRNNGNDNTREIAAMNGNSKSYNKGAEKESDDLDLESIRKQTAVITPLKQPDGSLYPSVNCKLGQEILKTACKLAHSGDNGDEEKLKELNGDTHESGCGNKKIANDTKDHYYFPNFHADTKLSGHHNSSDISVAHRMQQVQHQQLRNYYKENKDQICDANSWHQSRFTYFAQAAGMDKECISRHLAGHVETGKLIPTVSKSRNVTEHNATVFRDGRNGSAANMTEQQRRRSSSGGGQQQTGFGYQNAGMSLAEYQPLPMALSNGQQLRHMQQQPHQQGGLGMVQTAPVALFPVVPYRLAGPLVQPPPMHPANIRNIQTQQAEMSKTVKNKIDDILTSMFKAKIKSVRWRKELDNLRTLPQEKLQVIGKILVPINESDRQYISYHSTGSTILGYMLDGSEVAVKITKCLYRPFKPDDIDRLMSMETAHHQFVNKYRAIEVHDTFFYIATDLFEYTLPEYLSKMKKQTTTDLDLNYVKLVFQLLRGISTLHQQYLIVHAELRPDNILIDLEGNVKIGGYGFGRNVDRDTQFLEYSDEDKCWLAPEVLVHKQKISFKSDIWTAGMLIYYIFKGGENPFGSEPYEIIRNISDQSYKLQKVGEEPDNLIGMMLSLNRTERPAVSEALKHPLFWADEKRMRFINIVGSDIVRELKGNNMMDNASESMLSILSRVPCNLSIIRWMHEIDSVVIREMKSFRNYKNNFVDLIVFVFNCCNHFDTLSTKVREAIDEPCNYFLTKFPSLLMSVHRAIKASEKKDKPCYKPFF